MTRGLWLMVGGAAIVVALLLTQPAWGAWTEPAPGAPGSPGYVPPPNVVPGDGRPELPPLPDPLPGTTPPSESQTAICFLRIRPPTGITVKTRGNVRRLVRLVSIPVVSCDRTMTTIHIAARIQRQKGRRWINAGRIARDRTTGLPTVHARVVTQCRKLKRRTLQPRFRVIARATAFEAARIVYQSGWVPGVAKRYRCRAGSFV